MNQLTKVLLEGLLEDGKKKITAIYGGGFKPPTKGHFDVVAKATEQNPEIDDFLIYVGGGERNSITQGESIQIWELYKKYLPMKVQVVPVKSPIGDILRYAKEHPEEEVLWVIGARENNPEDFADIASRTRTLSKYPNIELRVIQTSGGVSGTAARKAAKDNNKEQFFKMIPDIEEKDQVWDTVTSVVTEIVTDTEVICDNCSWEWSIEDGGDDLYMCHKCGHDNNPDLGEASDPEAGTALPYGSGFAPVKENASYSKDIDVKEKILELTKHMLAKGMNIKPLPKVKFVNGDRDNARDFLGRTAYYNPNNSTITLYTEGRHPKDIVRSFSHEMIHHMQNLEDRLGDVSTTNTMEDDNIDKLEQEANLKGTMTFRNWTDSLNESLEEATQYIWKHREDIVYLPLLETKYKLKQVMNEEETEQTYLDEYKQKFLTELFEKDLPIIDKVSKNLYIVSNGDDIEAKYDIRLEIPERDLWSINWFFTPDNKNKSLEAWKQVTATSFKVLEDWLKTNNPKAIYISGNTGTKTKLYKTYIDKLQILLNNRYKIDNTDEDRIILRSIEEISQSSIKKRMETLNESYEQALNYWQNGDINSKSKIERWDSIKKKIKRKVLYEVYKLTDSYNQLKEDEIVSTEPIQQYTIYCDMDGVLVDFDKGYKALTGKETTHVDVQGKNEFWGTFRNGLEGRKMSEKDYWANLQWMPDGKDLWNHIKQYKPTLLSAPSRDPQSRWGKRIWVKKNIPGTPLILAYAESKKNYANKTAILIDDRISNINDWNAAGGIGILHTSTETTLEKLSKYGI